MSHISQSTTVRQQPYVCPQIKELEGRGESRARRCPLECQTTILMAELQTCFKRMHYNLSAARLLE